jgi:hypothetical protein
MEIHKKERKKGEVKIMEEPRYICDLNRTECMLPDYCMFFDYQYKRCSYREEVKNNV